MFVVNKPIPAFIETLGLRVSSYTSTEVTYEGVVGQATYNRIATHPGVWVLR